MAGVADLADLKLTPEQKAELKCFKQQVLTLGCALLTTLPESEVRDEILATGKITWIKVCRGDEEKVKLWPKVAYAFEDMLEPLFAASRAVEHATR